MIKSVFHFIQTARKDIVEGENVDLYLIILIGLAVAILGLAQVIVFGTLAAAILATLSVIAGSLLVNRRMNARTENKLDLLQSEIKVNNSIAPFLRGGYPDLSAELETAVSVKILGTNFATTAVQYFERFIKILSSGGSLYFLGIEPKPEIMELLATRMTTAINAETLSHSFISNIARIKSLKSIIPNTDQLKLRSIAYIPSHGLILITSPNGEQVAYVKMYPYKAAGRSVVFRLKRNVDTIWFDFFSEQFEKMWTDAKPIE